MHSDHVLADAIDGRIAAQWVALGGQLVGVDDRTAIDLDALVAITAAREHLDPRVHGVAVDWCVDFGSIINTARLRRIAHEMDMPDHALPVFGGVVASAGGPRWPFAKTGLRAEPRGKVVVRDLQSPARIAWRLRAGFGVSARSEILTILLTAPAVPVSISDLARRARFTKRNISLAVSGMSLANIVTRVRVGNEDRITLAVDSPLRSLLEPNAVPSVDWASRWAAVYRLDRVDTVTEDSNFAVRLVETRTEAESLVPLLGPAALPYPDLNATGSAWGDAFGDWLRGIHTLMTLMST
jgi:hypothetical protein